MTEPLTPEQVKKQREMTHVACAEGCEGRCRVCGMDEWNALIASHELLRARLAASEQARQRSERVIDNADDLLLQIVGDGPGGVTDKIVKLADLLNAETEARQQAERERYELADSILPLAKRHGDPYWTNVNIAILARAHRDDTETIDEYHADPDDPLPLDRAHAERKARVDQAEAALAALREQQAWRDIATAPLHEPVLVWDGSRVLLGRQSFFCWYRDGSNLDKIMPTHWLPLPAPPSEAR